MSRLAPHKYLCLCSAIAALALAAQVQAQTAPSFESLDKNADGKVSLNEAAVNDALFVAFERLDKDRDGMLTREEFAAYKPGR